jgi:hypothetical protein
MLRITVDQRYAYVYDAHDAQRYAYRRLPCLRMASLDTVNIIPLRTLDSAVGCMGKPCLNRGCCPDGQRGQFRQLTAGHLTGHYDRVSRQPLDIL